MPPKGAKKAKAPEPKVEPKKPATPTTPTTPRKPRVPTVYSPVAEAGGAPMPIMVKYEGANVTSKNVKDGVYTHVLKLQAPGAFSVVNTIVPDSGDFEGKQVIVLQPAKTFPFLKLNKEVRQRIYKFYLATKDGDVDGSIEVEGKRSGTKDLYAKSFADGSKNRVALLAVNKEISEEASPLLYGRQFRFENTGTLLDFLGRLDGRPRARLMDIYVKTWNKSSAKIALLLLAEATHLETLHIDSGILTEGDAAKAAKFFWSESSKLLTALSLAKGNNVAAVDVLSFGESALTYKNENRVVCNWSEDQIEDFREKLYAKLK